jgi:hypothetical protein
MITAVLPQEEFDAAVNAPNAARLVVMGRVDSEQRTVTVMTGAFQWMEFNLDAFQASGDGIEPDFSRFSVEDCGQTLRFGEYEVDVECFF